MVAGTATVVGVSLLTVVVLGTETYRSYAYDVLPGISKYRGACHNLSFCAIPFKLLDPLPHWMPVTSVVAPPHPFAALCGYLVLASLTLFVTCKTVLRGPNDMELLLSISIAAMLLVSPVTWDHYLLFLILPVAVLWQRLPRSGLVWPAFIGIAGLLCVEPFLVMRHCLILLGLLPLEETGRWLVTPLEILTALSVPSYALLGLFALLVHSARAKAAPRPSR